jgi:hypothetical protein
MHWAEASDEEEGEEPTEQRPGDVDESFAARRLRRWLQGMFGGPPRKRDEPREPEGERGEKES